MKTRKLLFAALAAVLVLAVVAVPQTVATWVQSWGVSTLFNVGTYAAPSFIGKADSSRFGKAVKFDAVPTFAYGIKSSNTTLATIDSFTTTSATDVVTISGASVGDVFLVTEYVPSYSTTPDTGSGQYGARVDSAGYVTVTRCKLSSVSTLKSGAQYFLTHIDK